MSLLWNISAGLLALVLLLYFFVTRHFKYWSSRGVAGPKPTPFLGNLKDVLFQKLSPGQFLQKIYMNSRGNLVTGVFFLDKPVLLLRDPQVIKNIVVKDFGHFVDRHTKGSQIADPLLTRGLFQLEGHEWKHMRNNLSPTFTSGRLKKMFHLVLECGTELKKQISEIARTSESVEVKELMGKTSTDVITTCAFGINSNCISNPDAEFREFGKAIFDFSFRRSFEGMSVFLLPWLAKLGRFKFFPTETTVFLRKVFWETLVAREEGKPARNDMIDQLIQLKNKGKMDDEDGYHVKPIKTDNIGDSNPKMFDFSGDDLLAQAGLFFLAGFETSSSTLAFTLYELALASSLQDRVRKEVNEVMSRHEGQVTYVGIMEMKYLDMVLSETLRKYPTLPFLDRVCIKEYEIPDTGVKIEKGTPIYVSVSGLQNDPEHFPEPDKFDPERFSEENKHKIRPYTYMPFGEGPRICIGMRFALMAMKTQLANILANVEVTPCAETPIPLVFNPQGSLLALAEGGIPLKFRHV